MTYNEIMLSITNPVDLNKSPLPDFCGEVNVSMSELDRDWSMIRKQLGKDTVVLVKIRAVHGEYLVTVTVDWDCFKVIKDHYGSVIFLEIDKKEL
jgi:hypothetical protein